LSLGFVVIEDINSFLKAKKCDSAGGL